MKIEDLNARFELYAKTHKSILHDPLNKKEHAFKRFTMASLISANRNGLKFPCLFLKTPEVEKDGDHDSIIENYDISFFVVVPVAKNDFEAEAKAYDDCKVICDDIWKAVLKDTDSGIFDGLQIGTSEGEIGPVIDNCFGWGVVFTVQKGFDAEYDPEKWEDPV